MIDLFAEVTADVGAALDGLCLMAVGGYGRGVLAPYSDLDLVMVHGGRRPPDEDLLRRLWYPMWDAGFQVGSRGQATFVEGVTARRQPRHRHRDCSAAGRSPAIPRWVPTCATTRCAAGASSATGGCEVLRARTIARHEAAGEAAFMLEPDLKLGRGGLRDAATVGWLEAADLRFHADDRAAVDEAERVLLDVRVALHRVTQRAEEILRLDDQDAVADVARVRVGRSDDDAGRDRRPRPRLGARGAVGLSRSPVEAELAGRRVRWRRASCWTMARCTCRRRCRSPVSRRWCCAWPSPRRARRRRSRGPRSTGWRPRSSRSTGPWPAGAVDEFVAFLLEGDRAIPVREALDHAGLIVRMLPEWAPVRSRPQRNAYHRYTVDRHLWEAAAEASKIADRVHRADLLVLGALLHDIGKGYPGDHTEVGVELVADDRPTAGPVGRATPQCWQRSVRHHLLLPDVATRRDLADPATIGRRGRSSGQPAHARTAGHVDRGRLAGDRVTGVEPVEGRAVEDLVERVRPRAGWRRRSTRSRGVAVPDGRGAGADGRR